ncbi:MAG: hypothetical protein JW840_05240 [Candidatus Thermoplasmatota archaeon]|nr:hypothetical protein [Candidatus Thermoplasmatota archaeon]
MNRYTKMYAWLYATFGTTRFTIDDFRMMFPSPQPTKTIHDLISLRYMKRIRHGTYQVIRPDEYVRTIVADNITTQNIVLSAKKPYAYCDSTAVIIWTNGSYWTDFTKGFKPIHIQVEKKDMPYWKDFFTSHDAEFIIAGEQRTAFGITYIIHQVDAITSEMKDGNPVIPLEKTIQFCHHNPLVYQPAIEFLEKNYHLGVHSPDAPVAP